MLPPSPFQTIYTLADPPRTSSLARPLDIATSQPHAAIRPNDTFHDDDVGNDDDTEPMTVVTVMTVIS